MRNLHYILLIRLLLSVIISFMVCRLFFKDIAVYKIVGLAVLIFGLAYLFEYLRNVGKGEKDGN